jgi:hypothetical protein
MRRILDAFAVFAFIVLATTTQRSAHAQTATFQVLVPLPGDTIVSASGISGDGNTIVGTSSNGDCNTYYQAVRWVNGAPRARSGIVITHDEYCSGR